MVKLEDLINKDEILRLLDEYSYFVNFIKVGKHTENTFEYIKLCCLILLNICALTGIVLGENYKFVIILTCISAIITIISFDLYSTKIEDFEDIESIIHKNEYNKHKIRYLYYKNVITDEMLIQYNIKLSDFNFNIDF